MHLLQSRLLRGPNRYAHEPCCEVVLAHDVGDPAARSPSLPAVVGRIAVSLLDRVGAEARVVATVSAPTATRLVLGYEDDAEDAVEPAIEAALAAVDEARAGRSFTVNPSVDALRAIVDDHRVDAATAAWLADARRHDRPVLRLDEDSHRVQIGWGARQRRFAPGSTPTPSADEDDGRIPVVAVTGTNGKTTTTLLIAHVVAASGARVGVTTTSGIVIDGREVERGDCTGPRSARTVLASPDVDVAVLETARGGLLKRGLVFDRCDVGVVLNIAADHLGLDGVETLADLAQVKGIVVRAAKTAAVLSAEDPLCVAMRDTLRPGCETLLFALDADHVVVRDHLAAGGRAALLDDDRLVWCDGARRDVLIDAAALPFTLGGHARYNVANALAALAALVGLGHAPQAAVNAMTRFTSDARQNPLRGNRFDIDGVTLVVDYAHNAVAYRALCAAARSLCAQPSQRLLGVVTSPGDRRTEDLLEVGGICGEAFDELVVYEHHPRGRAAGETVATILDGARAVAADKPLHGVAPIRQALAHGLALARPADVVVFTCAGTLADVVEGVRLARPAAADAIAVAMASESTSSH